ncbi:MAG TPA: endonuclease/exonuclease/phosphatase family protein, partial [Solirubrobacterales bacterium]|nr:endonuclease/exonuclease/phosphatase family protein [Solirubrobacterales bacterium]
MPAVAESPEPILDPPVETLAELETLRGGLDADLPDKILDRNLLVATWNVRAFGDMSDSWKRGAKDSPKRNRSDALAIAEVLSRFDVIAVQEAKANLRSLRHVMKALGPEWGLILTDVNPPPAGNGERLAFLFDTRRVRPSGLAAELVVPEAEIKKGRIAEGELQKQFVRTPYAVSFISGGQTFILITLHIKYGEKAAERTEELRGIAKWLSNWSRRTEAYNQNLICLGDFNIDEREGDPNFEALTSTGLKPPDELQGLTRTVSDKPGKPHYYDQIAWFTTSKRAKLTLDFEENAGHAGRFEWNKHLLTEMDPQKASWHISDHYPLWV